MRALVTVASKHGGTDGIGTRIADTLRDAGIDTDEIPPEDITTLDAYDAVVVGSGIYMGRWLGEARHFVNSHVDELRLLPVWLFASGPITSEGIAGDELDQKQGIKFQEMIGAREQRLFAGKVERDELGFAERTIIRMVHSPYGDYRPWGDISAWATEIAEAIKREALVPA